jgi:hypothetical protein
MLHILLSLYMYVPSAYFKCFVCFRRMLQMFSSECFKSRSSVVHVCNGVDGWWTVACCRALAPTSYLPRAACLALSSSLPPLPFLPFPSLYLTATVRARPRCGARWCWSGMGRGARRGAMRAALLRPGRGALPRDGRGRGDMMRQGAGSASGSSPTSILAKKYTSNSATLRLSLIGDLYGYPNPKWVAGDSKSASNRVPIRETHFGLSERHNPNMSIISPRNPFAERILFWVLLLEKISNRY